MVDYALDGTPGLESKMSYSDMRKRFLNADDHEVSDQSALYMKTHIAKEAQQTSILERLKNPTLTTLWAASDQKPMPKKYASNGPSP